MRFRWLIVGGVLGSSGSAAVAEKVASCCRFVGCVREGLCFFSLLSSLDHRIHLHMTIVEIEESGQNVQGSYRILWLKEITQLSHSQRIHYQLDVIFCKVPIQIFPHLSVGCMSFFLPGIFSIFSSNVFFLSKTTNSCFHLTELIFYQMKVLLLVGKLNNIVNFLAESIRKHIMT